MNIKQSLQNILSQYIEAKQAPFLNNELASKISHEYLQPFFDLLSSYEDRYIIKGSSGKGNWADCPWIGIFDSIITTTAQSGYYLAYLFDKEMSGVYLSLQQGVTDILKEYKRSTKDVLSTRSEDFRSRINYLPSDRIEIKLNSKLQNPKLYEQGSILAVHYTADDLPEEEILISDLKRFLRYYHELIAVDSYEYSYLHEVKQRKLHDKFDRCSSISAKVKKIKGYKCEACGLNFTDKYGALGNKFIETHHLIPFSSLHEGKTRLSINDFAVLCSNCHSMIHRLDDPSNLDELKKAITKSYMKG